jgi:hypothetical protein
VNGFEAPSVPVSSTPVHAPSVDAPTPASPIHGSVTIPGFEPSAPSRSDRALDEVADGSGDLVRAFVITGGRTRTDVPEVEIETIVCARSQSPADRVGLRREQRMILDALHGPMSVAEVAAHLGIPLRAAVIIISELVAAGTIVAGRNADTGDTDFLLQIRQALQLL